jgi:hypothetical protein
LKDPYEEVHIPQSGPRLHPHNGDHPRHVELDLSSTGWELFGRTSRSPLPCHSYQENKKTDGNRLTGFNHAACHLPAR